MTKLRCPTCNGIVPADERVLRGGPVELDLNARLARVNGEVTHLTFMEWELLELFMIHAGRALSRHEIIRRVWGSDYVGDTKTLDVKIKRLRRKIEKDHRRPRHIVTLRSFGYRFDP